MSLPRSFTVLLAACLCFARMASAEDPVPVDPEQQAMQAAWAAAGAAMVRGPAAVQLRDEATLQLPDGYGFIPRKESDALMKIMGNSTSPSFIGLVYPLADEKYFFLTLDYVDSGYIQDDDAREWDADELLQNLKDGTESSNVQRELHKIPPIKVTRWIEVPAYDSATHRLVWAAEVRLKHGEDPDPGVNYNTYVLGREGYVSLNLVTGMSTVDADKFAAHELLSAIDFKPGRRYADFESSTDKVAAYGLAALIGGIAAKKLGLLALLAASIAKFGKLIFVAVAAIGAGIAKWLRGRSAQKYTAT